MTTQARIKSWIRAKDLVQVIRGAESGRRTKPPEGADASKARALGARGRVKSVDRTKGTAIVEGVRLVKKAMRPDPRKGHRGGISEQDAPIRLSALMLVCRKCDRPVRVRLAREEKKRTRLCRRCGEEI